MIVYSSLQAIVFLFFWAEIERNRIIAEAISRRPNTALEVTVTAYSAEENQTDSTPTQTAFMTKVRYGTIAVSRDLHENGWTAGKLVYISGLGVYRVNDLMHKRKRLQLDIFMWSRAQEMAPHKRKAILLNL